jgi:hypothetical protein
MVTSYLINVHTHSVVIPSELSMVAKLAQQLSEDSGFESRAGFKKTCWPNGKASDYDITCSKYANGIICEEGKDRDDDEFPINVCRNTDGG